MRTIPDRLNLRAYCLSEAVKAYKIELRHLRSASSIIATAQAFEEYIAEGIDLPDHAHYPDTFLTVNNNNCPYEVIDEDEDEGIGFN